MDSSFGTVKVDVTERQFSGSRWLAAGRSWPRAPQFYLPSHLSWTESRSKTINNRLVVDAQSAKVCSTYEWVHDLYSHSLGLLVDMTCSSSSTWPLGPFHRTCTPSTLARDLGRHKRQRERKVRCIRREEGSNITETHNFEAWKY